MEKGSNMVIVFKCNRSKAIVGMGFSRAETCRKVVVAYGRSPFPLRWIGFDSSVSRQITQMHQ